jgi:hypothetical protein
MDFWIIPLNNELVSNVSEILFSCNIGVLSMMSVVAVYAKFGA